MRRAPTLLIGLFTVVLFVGVGVTLLLEQRALFGAIVIGIGVLRAVLLARQWQAMRHNARIEAEEQAEEREKRGKGPPQLP